mmetsp:Transcript_36936/g.61222  ORF Transcript_36936/g.61222 Transcript_36936/m.61222 type:complete len:133 (+) Transcript_36936:58-456(+)|eukprot:CAMPEP_0119323704 /NCGR_PEP_ID=MMETSP1333-20130426/61359_1 /TAXON_ID=418940 /ORGANISM="Scyphosphaera apsteinii, Strain RCC1455" /LENGTH=132 /DNA_ID=CAMNT_0007331213 /DNA_START=46 /DNA_END=444 /DNA_ORIENTATION=-
MDPTALWEAARWGGIEQALRKQNRIQRALDRGKQLEDVLNGDYGDEEEANEENCFEVKFGSETLGMGLKDDEDGRVYVSTVVEHHAAAKRKVPLNSFVVAINGESTKGKRKEDVRTMLKQASRPVTIKFQRP